MTTGGFGSLIALPLQRLPPGLVNRLIRLAAFQNPSFYSVQSMRRSTFNIPRVIACAELLSHHIALPRGCHDELEKLLEEHGIGLELLDKRNAGNAVRTAFLGELTSQQQEAVEALLAKDIGVLAATTAFGKTIVAIAAIAARKTNTLVLVHRRQVMQRLENIPDSEERVLIATGRYIGEGFDDARLDTLFLALPISWKGTLVQYVGRLHRLHPEKREVIVYDYADNAVPMLRRMTDKRIRGFKSLGYAISDIAHPTMI